MIKDGPSARNPDTAMRDLLRLLERRADRYHPARPTAEPVMAAAFAAPVLESSPGQTRIGGWVLTENDTGDLVAVHDDGTTRVVATREVS